MADSTALQDLRTALAISRQLLKLESRYRDPPRPQHQAVVSGLRGGASVMMVAAFENFMREVFLERLAPLATTPPSKPLSALPVALQAESIFESLQFALSGPTHGVKRKRVGRLPDVRHRVQMIQNDMLDTEALSQTKGNPNADNTAAMLKRLGLKDPFATMRPAFDAQWNKPEAISFLRDKLDEVVQRRHVVAHSANALHISRTDLQLALSFIEVLSDAIDKMLEAHIGSLLTCESG